MENSSEPDAPVRESLPVRLAPLLRALAFGLIFVGGNLVYWYALYPWGWMIPVCGLLVLSRQTLHHSEADPLALLFGLLGMILIAIDSPALRYNGILFVLTGFALGSSRSRGF